MNHQDSCSSGIKLWTTFGYQDSADSSSNSRQLIANKDDAITVASQSYQSISNNNGSRQLIITNNKRKNTKFHQLRWVVMLLASIGFALALIYCDCMAVAIVGMVKPQPDPDANHNGSSSFKQKPTVQNQTSDDMSPSLIIADQHSEEFNWNNLIQSLVINIYFIGYAIPQVPLAIAASRFGIDNIVTVSYIIAIICMFLLPIVATTFDWPLVLVIRFLKGLAGAAMYSIPIGMVDYWLPAKESTQAITLMMFVGNVGICLNPLINSYLTNIHWSLVFYVFGLAGIIWLVFWLIIVRDKPEQCWLMSDKELKMIIDQRPVVIVNVGVDVSNKEMVNSKLQQTITDQTNNVYVEPPNDGDQQTTRWPPCNEIKSDRDVYILIVIFIVYFGSYLSFINLLPTYFKNVTHLDMRTNGLLTFLIQAASLFASLWGGALLTYLEQRRNWSTRRSRLTVSAIAAFGSSIMWTIPLMRLPDYFTVIGFAANRALHPAIEICLIASVVERWSSRGLSGVMVSLYNSLGNFFSLIVSAFSGFLLDYEGNESARTWANLFMLYAIINIISWLLFSLVRKSTNKPENKSTAHDR